MKENSFRKVQKGKAKNGMDNPRIRRQKRKKRASVITNIMFCLIAFLALTGCIVLLLQNDALKNSSEEAMAELDRYREQSESYLYTQADLDAYREEASQSGREAEREELLGQIKSQMGDGVSTAAVLRDLYPEDVVVYADGKYQFFPILDTLKHHDYVYDNFISTEENELVYVDDTREVVSRKGIDVSRYQGTIDWEKTALDGVSYAFLRAGVRGSTEGKLMPDETFAANAEGALANGIQIGTYFFTQAVTEEEAIEEANLVLEIIEDYDVTYPVVYDLEEVTSEGARTANLTREDYTRNCIAFCETIKEAGYTPMIYGNLKTFMIMLDLEQLEDYDKWFAYYNTPVYFPYEFTIWQYTSEGIVDGIEDKVDLNICMKDYGESAEQE